MSENIIRLSLRQPSDPLQELRQRLGREPTEDEINEARAARMRQWYADMALTALTLQDEAEPWGHPIISEQHADRAIEGGKQELPDIRRDKEDNVDGDLGQLALVKELDFRELFDRVALDHERFDDEWIEDICDAIRSKGWLVGRQEWDSGGPGAGAGTVDVYCFRRVFIAENEVATYGPYHSFAEAAAGVGLFRKTAATRKIWVHPSFR
jgi:hypothetical protein